VSLRFIEISGRNISHKNEVHISDHHDATGLLGTAPLSSRLILVDDEQLHQDISVKA
jgi:hypothetical protein